VPAAIEIAGFAVTEAKLTVSPLMLAVPGMLTHAVPLYSAS